MCIRTEFMSLLSEDRFDAAKEVLQDELNSGRLIDPRLDRHWPELADKLSIEIGSNLGRTAVIRFWEDMLRFFVEVVEPKWGHAHKGHIQFRLGLALLLDDMNRAKKFLEASYQEDKVLVEEQGAVVAAEVQSAYVALALLERIEDREFSTQAEKLGFIGILFEAFDKTIIGEELNSQRVIQALVKIVPPDEQFSECVAISHELREALKRELPLAIVLLTGTLLEAVLLSQLLFKRKQETLPGGKDIRRGELGELFAEAEKQGVFPSEAIKAACRLVKLFRNRVHPGNEMLQHYKLTLRVAKTVKGIFEHALLKWEECGDTQGSM
ncbi:hypothetical protein YTPLAS18_18060 [Nitrospira sp.]|nr:hypothetical protein YTPLAS18_18060 [Nitrospira sp.]